MASRAPTRTQIVLALGALLFFSFLLPSVSACPSPLRCSNFTDSAKRSDCTYITSQGLPRSEQQQVLCTLWDGEYGYAPYQAPSYSILDTDLTLSYDEMDTSRIILAIKVLILLVFSYGVYCVLTRPSLIQRCLAV